MEIRKNVITNTRAVTCKSIGNCEINVCFPTKKMEYRREIFLRKSYLTEIIVFFKFLYSCFAYEIACSLLLRWTERWKVDTMWFWLFQITQKIYMPVLNRSKLPTVAVSTILKKLLELICSSLFHFFCIFYRVEGNNLLIKLNLLSRKGNTKCCC